ncbi:MAG: metabolite traffic protein EboE [bacterium]
MPNHHIMYCLNIHRGEHWAENLSAIERYALEVKNAFGPDEPFALGLRLSACAAGELRPQLDDFSSFLKQHNLYVVTMNGFPYGQFHGTVIKERVYQPDWTSLLRVSYTRDLAEILAHLLPEGETGTISTVPACYGKEEKPSAIANLHHMAALLAELEKKTGKRIILALEPEPDCRLDNLDSTLKFFQLLLARDELIRSYIGVCLDTCHVAVEFESPLVWLQRLTMEGIQVPKIQISAALRAVIPPPGKPGRILTPFLDQEYLHQTRILNEGNIHAFRDLPEALAAEPCGEWRIHFHVPLTWSGEVVSSTMPLLEDDFFRLSCREGKRHFEVETYSYWVLPEPKAPLIESIVSELKLLNSRLP